MIEYGPRCRRIDNSKRSRGSALCLQKSFTTHHPIRRIIMPAEITPQHLSKIAFIYVRQSTPQQVKHNRQSQQLQYDLVDLAKAKGWPPERIVVIDEDLGKSAAGAAHREGFETVLTRICLGEGGAIFCGEASRLARNGREWHQLIDFCAIVGTLIIDYEGAYDPNLPSDSLLLGVKGTVSKFELDLFRKRAQDAIRKKAQAGQLWFSIPAAFNITEDQRCEINPDLRIQQAINLVLQKFRDLSSIRQVHIWFCRENIELPVRDSHQNNRIIWRVPSYNAIHDILTNPLYAGAYIYPRTKTVTRIVDGKPVKSVITTPPEQYLVVIRDLFPSFMTWEEFEKNQKLIADNAAMKGAMARGAVRKGEALLAGLVRCQRCSRRMHVRYRSTLTSPRYICHADFRSGAGQPCPAVGAHRLELAVVTEVLAVLQPHAIQAALVAEEKLQQQLAQKHEVISRALEQAHYEADRIKRQLDAVEPEKGFVFRELTRRWEEALQHGAQLEQRHQHTLAQQQPIAEQERATLFHLAEDLTRVWNHSTTTVQTKKHILRTLIKEIWVQVQEDDSLIATVHWQGGIHTELLVKRFQRSRKRIKDDPSRELVHVVKKLTLCADDTEITRVLNRLQRKTNDGRTWTKTEVMQFRQANNIPAFSPVEYEKRGWLTLETAAKELGITSKSVKKLIKHKIIPAEQVVPYAPWMISRTELNKPEIRSIVKQMKQRHKIPLDNNPNQLTLE
jgi:DNA invertase Pin-like site-specific DNA recombinase